MPCGENCAFSTTQDMCLDVFVVFVSFNSLQFTVLIDVAVRVYTVKRGLTKPMQPIIQAILLLIKSHSHNLFIQTQEKQVS